MSEIKMKPCPFCGYNNPFIHAVEYDQCINIISCPKCHIEITVPTLVAGKKSNNKERVITAWNRRSYKAEYIEREKVLKLIGNFKRDDVTKHCVDYAAGWNEALEQIECNVAEDIPAADVRPERYGVWLLDDNASPYQLVKTYCSLCDYYNLITPYCPHCGAKIDRKESS